ncbi:M48 family peptidase [Rhodobacteraceae bacterium WD3A24]|nr:M48 family peptidase [Rhodobacteraceae bacterium WD3A24]
MEEARLPGDPPLTVTLRRTARARRMTLRVGGNDGRVTLSIPHRTSRVEALAFLSQKEPWIRGQLAGLPAVQRAVPGANLPVAGRERQIATGPDRSIRLLADALVIPDVPRPGARIAGWLKETARRELDAATARHAREIGRPVARLTLRDTRSRWGSCTEDGRLMFSWRLAMAPPEVLDYVAAHEVAHLAEMNHSPAFWATVAQLMPDYAPRRTWLRRHGTALMRWRFED